ncbi:RICIN domain-containing protein [Lentzea californiensis]|uniref:RICIN domain-containing protein n=1 Tax=Lentzea californiensis TaxID=438851 RepID=UPI002166ABDF|nr:RICIN domain-containing protein [Lentzea californiensis]MCR3751296.1 Ricin-type beta-trefoil lectin domain-containing protein [Lentzea californiensis]
MKKLFVRLVPAALAVVAAAGLSVAAAQPAAAAVTWKFQSVNTPTCLDGYVGHPYGDVYHTGCNDGAFQNFRWVGSFGRQTQLVSNQSNRCAAQAGDSVSLAGCNGSPSQVWVVSGSATRLSVRHLSSGKCLTRLGMTNVRLQPCDSGVVYQQWKRRA